MDIIIRNGTIVDGEGGEPYHGDVGIRGGRIVAVEPSIAGGAREEIDAAGCIVTPGFVDVHTHFDGQVIWSSQLLPSSRHGVTTVVTGNCGVGFAPCRPEHRALLLEVMEGVEDIPGIVMSEGLDWSWHDFPGYLDAVAARAHDVDVLAYLPHSPLRVFVMGERGARREPATPADLERMGEIVEQALRAGAAGFSTASVPVHRTSRGEHTPSFGVAEDELFAIAGAMRRAGRGVFQVLLDFSEGPVEERVDLLARLSEASGRPVTFTLAQISSQPNAWRDVLDAVEAANARPGVTLVGQVLPRPVGMLLGHAISTNPFRLCPSYEQLADLPFAERVARLRDPAVRAALLSETPTDPKQPLFVMARTFDRMFPLSDPPSYEPAPETSVAAQAAARGISPESVAYDLLLENDGRALMLVALANFADGNLDATGTMLRHPACIPGLGDGGAHYGFICDASYTTFMLTHWVRDRAYGRIDLAQAVAAMSRRPAELMGLADRGRIAVGLRADLNVIDHARLALHMPEVFHDLPAGGRRLDQRASGYVATIVAGEIVNRDDAPVGALPGQLVRAA